MRWQEVTWPRFGEAVKNADGVCVLPIGIVTSHGAHLPLGTDYLRLDALAARAAEIEPAIVFPPFYLGGSQRSKHLPGTIALKHRLMFRLLERTVEEISRNGLKKIVLTYGHWGVSFFANDFLQSMLHGKGERDYVLYMINPALYSPAKDPEWEKMKCPGETWAMGGEETTSLMLAAYPGLVKMSEIRDADKPRNEFAHLAGLQTAVDIFANHPEQYEGNARPATKEKGEYVLEYSAKRLAHLLGVVKRDTKAAEVQRLYRQKAANPMAALEHAGEV